MTFTNYNKESKGENAITGKNEDQPKTNKT